MVTFIFIAFHQTLFIVVVVLVFIPTTLQLKTTPTPPLCHCGHLRLHCNYLFMFARPHPIHHYGHLDIHYNYLVSKNHPPFSLLWSPWFSLQLLFMFVIKTLPPFSSLWLPRFSLQLPCS
jgi:hypothetical protein